MMSKRNLLLYKNLSTEDQRSVDRWLTASAVVGSIFAGLLVSMAIAESDALRPHQAGAESRSAAKIGAAETLLVRADQVIE
jgi:hypothetical protein